MNMDYKTVLLFLSVIQGIAAIRILNNFYKIPPLHEDTDEERAIVELKTEMHWSIGWLHGVHCELQDNGYSDLFFIDGKTVKKHACSSPGCGPICYANGCLSFLRQSDYVLKIRCDQDLFNFRPFTTDSDTAEMRIVISKNQEPKVFIDPGDVNLLASEACANRIIARVSYTDEEGNDVTLTCTGSDNFRLFQEYTIGSILIEKDLRNEKSNTFTVNVSARDRRNTVTQNLEIRLIATTTTTTITPASTSEVTEELTTPPPSIEVPILTAFTNRVTEELVTPPPSIEVPIVTDGNPIDAVVTTGIAPGYSYSNIWTVTSTTTEREKGGKIPPDKDIDNSGIYIVIALDVLAIVAAAAVLIIIRIIRRYPRINGYRKLKEKSDDLDEIQQTGVDNPTYVLIISEKT